MKKKIVGIFVMTLLIVVALPVSSNMKYTTLENVNNKSVSYFWSPAVQWTSIIGGTGLDAFVSVQQTSDGGFIMTGESFSYSGGLSYNDIWLVKTDGSGNVQINTRFGVAVNCWDYGMDVQQTSDGGYIVTGYSESFGTNNVFLMKTNGNLIYQWDITYGGSFGDWGNSLDQTTGGGFIIAGGTYSFGAGDSDVWLIKTDSSGNKIWDKTFGGINFDQATSVQQPAMGDIYYVE